MYFPTGGKGVGEPQDSDVVRVRSAGADADGTLRSLIQTDGGSYMLPPMATVTLERVHGPGEWEANGHRVRHRLFPVAVAYRC